MVDPLQTSRRNFVQSFGGSAAMIALGCGLPRFLKAAVPRLSDGPREKVTVILQLSGGNDGLNTVIPYRHDIYKAQRPTLSLSTTNVIDIGNDLGINPAAKGLADLFHDGSLAIVQGVGYDKPNRSHFESMDIWHTCQRKDQMRSTGWVGRALDFSHQSDLSGMHVGRGKQPLALAGRSVTCPTVGSPDEFRLQDDDDQLLKDTLSLATKSTDASRSDLLDFLNQNTSSALSASQRIAEAMKKKSSSNPYPETELGKKFETIGRMIAGDLETRIYYVELDGFDTHSAQAPAHNALLSQWSEAVTAFQRNLQEIKRDQDVVVFCFSEFGRRVSENASEGTDHGAAAPVLLAGTPLRGGLVGEHPSLDDLEEGDLKHHTDFRQVYATLLEDWMGWNSEEILGRKYPKIPLFS
jgi:uncharacterized protein (DUF1501 family)